MILSCNIQEKGAFYFLSGIGENGNQGMPERKRLRFFKK